MKTQADILLVTVTKVESLAVLEAFEKHTGQKPRLEPRGDKTYHALGTVNGARVWLVLSGMGAGGLGGAQQTVAKAIAELGPDAVVMVGIAFGVDEQKQAIGDILVSENLRLYELQRISTKRGKPDIILRGDRPHCSPWLLDAFRNGDLHWQGARVRFGCVLTGEKLVDNLDFRAQLRAFEPEAIGGEMEGDGLYTACQDAKVDWLLVKAICDWADGKKEVDRQQRQQLAARNAAEFVVHVLATIPMSKTASAEPAPDDATLLQALTTSLRPVAEECSKLVTRGLTLGGDPLQKPLRLAHVYVSLGTKSARPGEEKEARSSPEARAPLTTLEVLLDPNATRVVLVGDPGSGKSTFLQYVTLCLADQLCVAQGMASQLSDHEIPALLQQRRLAPFRVLLREFAPTLDPAKPGTAEQVVSYLRGQLGSAAAERLPELLKRGLAFVLFDGLDEVPRPLVPVVKQAIESFPKLDYYPCRVAVTCRTESYKREEFHLEGFPAPHEIAPLSSSHRSWFVHAWYHELELIQPQFKGEGAACAASLLSAMTSDRLREMAGNPFFLTAMAALHRPDKPLPDTSAELMHKLVDGVLEESRRIGSAAGSRTGELELAALLKQVNKSLKDLRWCLQEIAYTAREKRQDRASRFVEEDLLRARLAMGGGADKDWVDKVLHALLHRAGVLQSHDARHFEFAYRFEEFLAGCHLANGDAWAGVQPSFAARALDLLERQGDYARQVVLWAAGVNAHVQSGTRGVVRELVSLLVESPTAAPKPRRSRSGWIRPSIASLPAPVQSGGSPRDLFHWELAADIARDAGMEHWADAHVANTSETVTRLRAKLEEVRDGTGRFEIQTRARAASAIGRLGDPRDGVGLRDDGLPDLVFGLKLPAGDFTLAENSAIIHIEKAYKLSLYPVTVAQFQAFVAAGGYEDDGSPEATQRLLRWWGEEGLKWKRSGEISGPEDYDPVFQTPNHPCVGVSWFEAKAFCQWLTEQSLDKGVLQEGQTIRLPNEAEWEQAARWNKQKDQADDRRYPWGGSEEKDLAQRCNWDKTGIGHTSAVGLFPSGQADCGALDMSGNVWEWCENWYDEDTKRSRVMRGGSWADRDPERLSCACRRNLGPEGRNQYFGFRCVLVGVGSAPTWQHQTLSAMPDGCRACPARAKRSPNRLPHAPAAPGKRRGRRRGR